MSKITVYFQAHEYPSSQDRTFAMEIDPMECEAWDPLDLPCASSGIFCTPDTVVRRVQRSRAITHKEIATAILAAMRSADTYDGDVPIDPITGFGRAS